jgi:hypothetical protein
MVQDMRKIAVTVLALACLAGPAFAQSPTMTQPPSNGMKLSQLLAKVEIRDKFQYISEVDWSESGYYEVIYYTSDKAKVELHLDAVTGETK